MKLFHTYGSPNARRVRIFLAEKGIKVAMEECWDRTAMSLTSAYLERYPFQLMPMLELDDGSQIGESIAICRYFEALYPQPSLFGRDALEQASTEMWLWRMCDAEIGAEEMFRNAHPSFVGRGLAGTIEHVAQIPALVDRGKSRVLRLLRTLDAQLRQHTFVAGPLFSIADITAWCALDFAKVCGIELPHTMTNVQRWYAQLSGRPSAKA
jgi:glutathione S-transferase